MSWYNPNTDKIDTTQFYTLATNNRYLRISIGKFILPFGIPCPSFIANLETGLSTYSLAYHNPDIKLLTSAISVIEKENAYMHIKCKPKDFIKCLKKMMEMRSDK